MLSLRFRPDQSRRPLPSRLTPLTLLLSTCLSSTALASHQSGADTTVETLPDIVVTGQATPDPLQLRSSTRDQRQTIPAADGAGLLKSLPGFSVIRKGGSSGDPLLRGLGGSRLAVTTDGGYVLGGCGGRMDPPTAYIFPDSYDVVEVIKGPQSVRMGSGLISGGVNFERQPPQLGPTGKQARITALVAGAERRDLHADLALGTEQLYGRVLLSDASANDYRDGAGRAVHSEYQRQSQTLSLGLRPDKNSEYELNLDRSRAEAAYADRMMDGARFDREALSLKGEWRGLGAVDALRLAYQHSWIDHEMNNFTLRPQTPAAQRRLSNPDRRNNTLRLEAELDAMGWSWQLGLDRMQDRHRGRSGLDFASKPRSPTQSFDGSGLYIQGHRPQGQHGLWHMGLRQDHVDARYSSYPATDPAALQRYRLDAAFARYEHTQGAWRIYAGLGMAQRAPDFWERNRSETLRPERNLQADVGASWSSPTLQLSVSTFAGEISDFILVQTGTVLARNIDVRRAGLEFNGLWRFAAQWRSDLTLAHVHASNRSDQLPLAQTPPTELKWNLAWDNGQLAMGTQLRAVARQNRVAPGQGNIVGTDIGTSPGFSVLSLHAGWRPQAGLKLIAGLDNLGNELYAEHISKAGALVMGYPQTQRVMEPGRTWWIKLSWDQP